MVRLEDILTGLANARERRDVGEVFAAAMRSEGYDNVVLARLGGNGIIEVPWQWVPKGYAETYFGEGWFNHDPILAETPGRRLPFAWDDAELTHRFTARQMRMMADSVSVGVHSGLTIPFHGLGSDCDVISISQRGRPERLSESRRGLVVTAGLHALMRYIELKQNRNRRARSCDLPQLDDPLLADGCSPFRLPPGHLRALVQVDAAERRWRMGLTLLGRQIYLRRKTREFTDLERWGLIADVPDDWRWLYYLAPTPLGRVYLNGSPDVARLRAEIRARDVDRRETPDEVEED